MQVASHIAEIEKGYIYMYALKRDIEAYEKYIELYGLDDPLLNYYEKPDENATSRYFTSKETYDHLRIMRKHYGKYYGHPELTAEQTYNMYKPDIMKGVGRWLTRDGRHPLEQTKKEIDEFYAEFDLKLLMVFYHGSVWHVRHGVGGLRRGPPLTV
jgi:hypothetical protein